MRGKMNRKEYKLPNGRTAVFEYDDNGVGRISLEALDILMGNYERNCWIPVTERLPEAEEMGDTGVIATVVGEEGNVTYRHDIVPDAWYENGSWHVYGVRLKNARVIAWMPLPEPYKEEQE